MTSTERPEQAEALRRAISLDRLGTYNQAANATGADVLDLYIWDRDLSAAFLADIAIIEVALRNAMHTALSNSYGEDWYTRPEVGLDDRSEASIAVAWRRLHERRQPQTSGRVVAQLMLGFWVGLLDSGGERGKPPESEGSTATTRCCGAKRCTTPSPRAAPKPTPRTPSSPAPGPPTPSLLFMPSATGSATMSRSSGTSRCPGRRTATVAEQILDALGRLLKRTTGAGH